MGSTGSLAILGLSIVGYLLGLAAIIAGLLTPSWFVLEANLGQSKIEEGILKTCSTGLNDEGTTCTERDNIFKFDDGNELEKEKDTVMIILIISSILCFIAILLSLVMICYRRNKASWRCAAVSAFIFGLLAAIIGLAGLGYAESEFKDKWVTYKHGYSNIICWVGCGGIILGAIMSVLLTCITPGSESSEKNVGVHYVGNRNPTYQHDTYNTNY